MSLAFARRLTVQSLSSCKRVGVGVGGAKRWKSDTCKVLTISSGKGGVGKTTTAASFSYGLAKKVCYCFTTSLPHCFTALLHCFTKSLHHYLTTSFALLFYCITALPLYCTTSLLHYCITTSVLYCITSLLLYCITALSDHCFPPL
jgi:hypothetical protein